MARLVDVRGRQHLVHKIAFCLRSGAPSLMSRTLIASATENERHVEVLGIASGSFHNAAGNRFPENADTVAVGEQPLFELGLVLLH